MVSEEFRKQRQLCLSAGAGFPPRWKAWDSIPTDTVSIWIICPRVYLSSERYDPNIYVAVRQELLAIAK
ncbi:MAG: hypothetical protein OEW62_10175 [Candidatus Bathyarchaeota archaeon]|nr:hypothetical protein [Candidatus Bathyarchaeota archaeon]